MRQDRKLCVRVAGLISLTGLVITACGGTPAVSPTAVASPTTAAAKPTQQPATAMPVKPTTGATGEAVMQPTTQVTMQPTADMMMEPTGGSMMAGTPSGTAQPGSPMMLPGSMNSITSTAVLSATDVAGLRSVLTSLFAEHVLMAGNATGALLDGRDAEFQAAHSALDTNSTAVAAQIGAIYGADKQVAFLPVWQEHIGYYVDYANALKAKDNAKQESARSNLLQYPPKLATVLNSVNPDLPVADVSAMVKEHVAGTMAVIDAQAAKDFPKAYALAHTGVVQMADMASTLADAIAKQFPDRFPSSASAAGAMLRANLTMLLVEHTGLAGNTTGALLGGRDAEYKAASDALDTNSNEVAKAIGGVYGAERQSAFLPVWKEHINYYVDYANGYKANDQAKRDSARNSLLQYPQKLAGLLNSVNPNLRTELVTEQVADHVTGTMAVIDAQAAKDLAKAYDLAHVGITHITLFAGQLADAIRQQFPDKYPTGL